MLCFGFCDSVAKFNQLGTGDVEPLFVLTKEF